MRGSLVALLGSVVVIAASCSVYDEAMTLCQNGQPCDNPGGKSGGGNSQNGGEGGTGGDGAPGGGGTVNYCLNAPRATYPGLPSGVAPSTKDIEIVGAQYEIDLGDSPKADPPPSRYRTIGFDLDSTCTTAENPKLGTCRPPSYATGVVDGPGGIDNALGLLIQGVREQIGDFNSENYTKDIQAGKTNVLLRLQKWNGEPNDDEVTVSTMVAGAFDSFAPGTVPEWKGNDAFPIASDSLNGSIESPKFADTHAYVSDNKVVATLAEANLRLEVGLSAVQRVKLDLKLSAAFVVCDIIPTTEGNWGYTFERCTLGGRWLANDLVAQIGQFPNPLDNNRPLCRGNQTYETFKVGICSQVDILRTLGSPSLPCDALSIGVTFTMRPALLGNVYQLQPFVDRCCSPPGCVPGTQRDFDVNPKYDCCESLDSPDGSVVTCGASPPPVPPSGGPNDGGPG